MKPLTIITVALLLWSAALAQHSEVSNNTPAFTVADQYYWAGPEGNLGIELVGKFRSKEALGDTLHLLKPIGTFKAKKYPFSPSEWVLRDVLISIDLNASGDVVRWRVSGPRPLLTIYLENLKKGYEDGTVFYDFGYTFLTCKPAAD